MKKTLFSTLLLFLLNVSYSITAQSIAPSTNDECLNAIPLAVNSGALCVNFNSCVISEATHSPEPTACTTTYNDVWYSFTATSGRHIITITNLQGSNNQDMKMVIYSGSCGNLTALACMPSPSINLTASSSNFVIGQTYYLRLSPTYSTSQMVTFDICIKSISSCESAPAFCGSTVNDPYIFENTAGIPSTGQIACLGTNPNPAYYTLKVTESGPLLYTISQNTQFDAIGNPTGLFMDVDFAAWGPFAMDNNCSEIIFEDCPTCPFDNFPPTNSTFYPFGNIVDCSYSSSYTETLSIPNAVAGEYYKVLVTNFSNNPGFIKLEQTNFSTPGAGKTVCADKMQLVAFVDVNNNGIRDNNEYNFSYGTFNYQINNTGDIISASSPFGKYNINDPNPSNTYDISYQIYPEYAAYYALTPTNYNDVSVVFNGGTQFIYFPLTITQPYTDAAVSIVAQNQPVAGSTTFINKIVYKNLGLTPTSGTLSFVKDPAVAINTVSQTGITNNATGFSYDFVNLAPFEIRSIVVTMTVPAIPSVNIDDVLNFSASITTPVNDINSNNNSDSIAQIVVASYDPNDKMEAHGNEILLADFDNTDFLNYTIRFQNTGTSNAIDVRLEDFLDSRLDEQSIRMVDASHNYTMDRVYNKVVWNFNGIQLKPQAQSETSSKGYVNFKIKPKPGYVVGTIIPNTASIYFDSNPPIVTNTFNTKFVTALGNVNFDSGNLALYPNPTHKQVQIDLLNTSETINTIKINDVSGKCIKNMSNLNAVRQTLDVSDFAKGIYFVEITTKNNLKQIKKLIVE
ncbi:T9SS type A sorting domain-containing protein [Flavobacterium sp.]|uniref:T9SS type A sorting domain-containing protein n=1 Tax=Flavobacterium sp. TaxID=239 RepID=UPI00260A044A|nr:T9SS type A sorting domain-containing protein [Flavobacterium sp.]